MSETKVEAPLKVKPMREIYVVAVSAAARLSPDAIKDAFAGEQVDVVFLEEDFFFSVRSAQGPSRVDVLFESRVAPLGWAPELLDGNPEAREVLIDARGFYRVRFAPGQPESSVAVFEALWTVRTLLEMIEGVVVDSTAFKIHGPQDIEEITELDFDIRDHVTIHSVQTSDTSYWLHSHGLAKFAQLDVEVFHIPKADLTAAETFLYELCNDLAFGHGPKDRASVSTSVGLPFQLIPSEEARMRLNFEPERFEGHLDERRTIVSTGGKHILGDILKHYRERFEAESDEEAAALMKLAKRLLPTFKARFFRKGLMEPLTFLVRAAFEVHPEGLEGPKASEKLWAEVVTWDELHVVGKLVDGCHATTEWRKGAQVDVNEAQIDAIAVHRDGRPLDPTEMDSMLREERPA